MQRDSKGRFIKRGHGHTPRPMADRAFLFLELNRETGVVTIDEEFSTPAETYAMLCRASQMYEDKLDRQETD